ncbi:hypothetical protein M419DRAFT_35303 [Trichoderma reesei RUT C-30]|uniref:Uncharacterized protein n=1 Tax=Hypocrea jecorina (strain ATCC 56765 / BCRC 32924 / NRRL 11460 / Rut C-30) TaxID=1344414 RepID=A0A024SC15_HYPJR|nr:hypothetical protein M419DRAFT_35303 [Trichoderma reesei RUT C-30]
MAFDNSFLSPRGLLVNNNSDFVCHGPNFAKLKEATQATENLPYCDQMFDQRFGFSDLGHMEIYVDIISPLIKDFFSYGYRSVRDICKTLVQLSATAEEDYDEIFDALARLYGDESNNDTLRYQVQQTIRDRLERLRALSDSADGSADILTEAIDSVTQTELSLKRFKDVTLDSDQTVERLRKCHEREQQYAEEHFQDDMNALEAVKKLVDQQNTQDNTQDSLQNLQQAVGATVEIVNDLTALSDYVAEHMEPGPGPLLNLEKAALLEMWKNLETEVQKFLDEYMS